MPEWNFIDAAVRSVILTRAEHKAFYDYRIERRRPSYAKLEKLVATLETRGASSERLAPIRTLIERQLLFAPITGIEHSRAQVYDLTVPGTPSFVANGFINHNTFLAVAMAVQYLMSKRVNRIVLARPAVEAGERSSASCREISSGQGRSLSAPSLRRALRSGRLRARDEVHRKARDRSRAAGFMRGRTLGDAFVILDEAQNSTSEQMKMFLTRIGFGSKAVITGDVTQIDLPSGRKSGSGRSSARRQRHRRNLFHPLRRARRRPPSTGANDHQGLR